MDVDLAHGAHLVAAEACRQISQEYGQFGRRKCGILAQVHRRGSCMVALAFDRYFLPGDALHARDGADANLVDLQQRPLLDVELHEGVRHHTRTRSGSEVADTFQFIAESGSIDTDHIVCRFGQHTADVDEGPQHVGRVPRTLFVREDSHGERTPWFDTTFLAGLDDLESGEHAVVAVVETAGAHGVDVRAGHHRRARTNLPGSNDVSDHVDGDVHVQVPHPRHHEIAAVAVGIGQCETVAAPTWKPAHLAECHDSVHQATVVDVHPSAMWGDELRRAHRAIL